jgi:hypothetical protein
VTDPVSWLQIEKGWNVVSADGVLVGKVVEVTGDEHDDIFDGLAVKSKQSAHVRYVPGEQVAAIFPGEVTLKIASAETDTLEPFSEPAPQTKIRPQEAPLGNRISSWLRGKR